MTDIGNSIGGSIGSTVGNSIGISVWSSHPLISLYYKVILSVCLCALESGKLPNGFAKFFLRLVDLSVDIVRKMLDFYMS